jgi:multiple sugar transport system ATP-binding protein
MCASVRGEVELVEPLGAEAVVYLKVGDLRVATRTSGPRLPATGDALTLTADVGSLHLFDARSGARLD